MIVRSLIKSCGGPAKVADATRETAYPVTVEAVFKWYRNGIPEDHWPVVMALGGCTLEQIYSANRVVEQQSPARKAKREARAAA
jgi:hypothetical protein